MKFGKSGMLAMAAVLLVSSAAYAKYPRAILAAPIRYSSKADLGYGRIQYRGLSITQGGETHKVAIQSGENICIALASQEGNDSDRVESATKGELLYPKQKLYVVFLRTSDEDPSANLAYPEATGWPQMTVEPLASVICRR